VKASRHAGRAPRRDPALQQAHEVVGLYGDPDTSWGIAVDLGVREIDPDDVGSRLAGMCADHEHLGMVPTVEVVPQAQWRARRADLAAARYEAGALLRVAVRLDGRRLFVGAHHGAVDGLGLVAVAGVAMGHELTTLARGVGERRAASGFVRSSLGRLREALVDPPPRFAGQGGAGLTEGGAEDLSERTRPLADRGTAHLAVAAADVFGRRGHEGLPLLVVGASRRASTLPEPDRQTAYLRIRVPVGAAPGEVRRALAAAAPEPDFPATSARGLGPWVTHLVRRRLGATALLSNLGRVDGPVESVAMFPACSGPRAVAIGLASTQSCSTLSLRTRRAEFSADEHARLLDELADRFFGQ
jgi:hypothetical protein